MKVCVFGLGHLGQTTAACLADLGIQVIAIDQRQIQVLKEEPGLEELIKKNEGKNLNFHYLMTREILKDVDYLWVCFDTPVDKEDVADTDYVLDNFDNIMKFIDENTNIIISSQLPVGTIRFLESEYPNHIFASAPENLRHGSAIEVFTNPDRIVVGLRKEEYKCEYMELFEKISKNIEWMSIESAESIKHFINAFFAFEVVFANIMGDFCNKVGADHEEVTRGLLTEGRIGSKAYLKAGKPYSGGTLSRDIKYLIDKFKKNELNSELFKCIKEDNDRRLSEK